MQDRMKIDVQTTGNIINLKFSGSISELANFPDLNLENISQLALDFGEVPYINSAGVRRWVKWMWGIEKENSKLNFSIQRCSSRIVRQILAINNFIPKTTEIKSFLVPYYCENDSENLEKLFQVQASFKDSPEALVEKLNEVVKCPKCGNPMELDALPEDYFTLIQRRP